MNAFSWTRFVAIVQKEFIQMRRDRLTFGMMVGIPLMQLMLFGFAINFDPKGLPTAVMVSQPSAFSRSFVAALETSGYFNVISQPANEAVARQQLDEGEVQFIVSIPDDFSRRLVRGEHPQILVEADASDPAATGNALGALSALSQTALNAELTGALAKLKSAPPPFELILHRNYNPEGVTQYNIVPGLMGVILTMTMIMMTSLAITRERERGTMEALLAMPVRPLEVTLGKIIPYILIAYIQVFLILAAAHWIFQVPLGGSMLLLLGCVLLFVFANLAVGITFSTLAKNQMQAMQMTFFFFLPSLLLSGFMFPFRGMPDWAQHIGSVLPLTHFLRIVRGILLKGNDLAQTWPHVWPLLVFLLAAMTLAMLRYRRTLD
jgi:ABC-2 type transport system permease protein